MAGGAFSIQNGVSANFIARFNADGTPDTTFRTNIGTGFSSYVRSIKIQSDGKIVMGGDFLLFNNTRSATKDPFYIARLIETNVAPTASSVSISGTPNISQLLTGSYTYADANGDTEGISTFRWLRDDVAIDGATSSTYMTVLADVGHAIKFEVTPVASTGLSPGAAVTSAGVSIVAIAGTVTTAQATEISRTTAKLNGSITDIGGELVTTRGFEYGKTITYGTTTNETGSFNTGDFSVNITDLSCGNTYHYKSYATNSVGTAHGNDVEFNSGRCPSSGSFVKKIIQPPVVTTPTTNPIESGNHFADIKRIIKLNTNAPEVKEIQVYLNTHGYLIAKSGAGSPGKETTKYGPLTKKAIMKFQKDHGLKVDGIIGPKTLAEMR